MVSSELGGSVPELMQEVTGRLVSVEEGLAALDNHRRALHNHSALVKEEVAEAVERGVAALRAREKYLLRQVELVSSHQNSAVTVTQAQLLQHKGALAVTRTILDTCGGSVASSGGGNVATTTAVVRSTIASTVACVAYEDVAGLLQHAEKLVRIPLVSVHLEEPALCSTIQRFGRVQPPPSLQHSHVLPTSFEEYGDIEHDVLHKSVVPPSPAMVAGGSGVADKPKTITIDMRKPYLLAAKKAQAQVKMHEREVTGNKKEDLARWLHRMHLDGNGATTSLEDLQLPTSPAPRSCVPTPAPRSYAPTPSSMLGEDDDVSTSSCCCVEDLVCPEVCIERACQANETCSSFSRCVRAGQCKRSAQEKHEQTLRWRNLQHVRRQEEEEQGIVHLQYARKQSVEELHFDQNKIHDKKFQKEQGNRKQDEKFQEELHFALDLSVSRKRHHSSDDNSAMSAVLNHMAAIVNSNNSGWLIKKTDRCELQMDKPASVKDLCDTINKLGLGNASNVYMENKKNIQNFEVDPCKRMKICNTSNASNESVNFRVRTAILYQPPASAWILSKYSANIINNNCPDISNDPDDTAYLQNTSEKQVKAEINSRYLIIKNNNSTAAKEVIVKLNDEWLLPFQENQVATKKEHCEKENMCKATLLKTKLNCSMMSTENNEKTDKSTCKLEKNEDISDIDQKLSWLLNSVPEMVAFSTDNKTLEEGMKKKCEWLSDTSLSSFSIITDPDDCDVKLVVPTTGNFVYGNIF